MKELVQAIYKRKSVRKYDVNAHLSQEELQLVKDKLYAIAPLVEDIKLHYEIVPCNETNCKFNAEYCLVCYSEQKDLWLTNVGYVLEQWELYLATLGIGVCWYGMGKVEHKVKDGLTYAIMLCFGKCDEEEFRKDTGEFNRKQIADFWQGDTANTKIAQICRLAPSAVNSQPWKVVEKGDTLEVYRQKSTTTVLAPMLFNHFNKVDAGIFLAYLEIALESEGYAYTRTLHPETKSKTSVLVASYLLQK